MESRETVWVCFACGKRSKDQYGNDPINKGWDESCFLNSYECYVDKLTIRDEFVVTIEKGALVNPTKGDHELLDNPR